MFCPKCGKKNEDSSLFCTWCGAGFGSISTRSLNAAPEPAAPAAEETPAPQPAESEKVLQTVPSDSAETAAPDVPAVPAAPAESANPAGAQAFSLPTPGVIPQSSAQLPNQQSAPKPEAPTAPAIPVDMVVPASISDKPGAERRYYTGKHIAICLIVAGIMAAAAGVFAGLYFSTIL